MFFSYSFSFRDLALTFSIFNVKQCIIYVCCSSRLLCIYVAHVIIETETFDSDSAVSWCIQFCMVCVRICRFICVCICRHLGSIIFGVRQYKKSYKNGVHFSKTNEKNTSKKSGSGNHTLGCASCNVCKR